MSRILCCILCQQPAEIDALMLTIEASEGLRDNGEAPPKWSPIRTVTRGIMVCDGCFPQPEMAIVRAMITHPTTESDLFTGRHCVVLCRHQRRGWIDRLCALGRPSRGRCRCPSCGRRAHSWPVNGAPPRVKERADAVVLGHMAEEYQLVPSIEEVEE
jgi:hypothetical protein